MLIKLASNDYWWDLDDAVLMEIDTADIFSLSAVWKTCCSMKSLPDIEQSFLLQSQMISM